MTKLIELLTKLIELMTKFIELLTKFIKLFELFELLKNYKLQNWMMDQLFWFAYLFGFYRAISGKVIIFD